MTVEVDTPAAAIEGIGPATASRLADSGIHYALDLLRITPETLHDQVASTHSPDQARQWRVMASLLEIEPMSAQWAEALVVGGIETVEELSRKALEPLRVLFEEAAGSGLIPSAPKLDEIAEMKRDATALFYTGALTGTLLDSSHQPIADARVQLGHVETTTNRHGRFRLVRVPLGSATPLYLSHDGFRPLVVESPPVGADPEAVAVHVFHLEEAGPGDLTAERLSEFVGDELPAMSGFPVRTESMDTASLRQGDVFMVQRFYKRTPDALLVSRFRDFQHGELIALTARVPRAQLPNDIEEKDHVTLAGGDFERLDFGPRKHQFSLAIRRFTKLHPQPASTPTPPQALLRSAEMLDFLQAEGLLGKRPENL